MPDEPSQESSLQRSIEERVAFIRDNRKRGGLGYTVAATESAKLIELAVQELIRRYLHLIPESAHLKFLDEERKTGEGKVSYRNFTMGQLVGLVRASRFIDALSDAVELNLTALRRVYPSLNQIVDLRNEITHKNHQATAAEADLVFSAVKAFLETLGILVLEEGQETSADRFQRQVVWNIPYERNPYFTGREAELTALAAALTTEKSAALTQASSGKAQALSGLGGIGKTQTAIEYAWRCREGREGYPAYEAILFTRADAPTALLAGYADIARALDLTLSNPDDPQQTAAEVRHWLETHENWLLLCDNADEPGILEPFRPRNAQGHLLLTSRAHSFKPELAIKKPITLHNLRPEEALSFLYDRTGRCAETEPEAEQRAAVQLVAELGYFPLALEQAAGYIVAREKRFAAYLQEYRKREQELLNASTPETGDYRSSQNDREYRTVATTWDLNFQAIEEIDPASAELLRLSAFLAPDAIPAELIIEGADQLGPPLSDRFADLEDETAIESAYDDLLAPILRYSLIDKDREAYTYSLHRMVQSVQRERLKEKRQPWIERVVRAVNAAFPHVEFQNWEQCARLLAQALACLEHARKEQIETKEAARLCNQVAYYLNERGLYAEAEPLYREALAILRKALPEGHPDIATSLNNLAGLYRDQGRTTEAEPLYREALAILRKALPEGHPDIALSLNNLAEHYRGQGRTTEAEPLFREALAMRRKALPEGHPDIALSLNNLAELYRGQGRSTEAEPLYREALATFVKALGPQHPNTRIVFNNVVNFLTRQGRKAEAEALSRQFGIPLPE
jgi:tetratricopeptide (TPR) repeat protein